jgi:trigger factor
MRDATMAELASQVADADVPESLYDAETSERFQEFQRSIEGQGSSIERFLQLTHQSPDDLVAIMRAEAMQSIKVDLALRAVALDEQLEASPEALDKELTRLAGASGRSAATLREELDRGGRLGALRAATTKQLAADWVLERVTYVDETGSVIDRALLEADEAADDAGDGAERVDQSSSEPDQEEQS